MDIKALGCYFQISPLKRAYLAFKFTLFGKDVDIRQQKQIPMKRYFCLCVGGLQSDSDASVAVESFKEIEDIADSFLKELGKKRDYYITQHIFDKSPDKFPHWGKTYMVIVIIDGNRFPIGYCNFEKDKSSSISWILISCWTVLLVAAFMAALSLLKMRFDAALWSFNCMLLVRVIMRMMSAMLDLKLSYLLK